MRHHLVNRPPVRLAALAAAATLSLATQAAQAACSGGQPEYKEWRLTVPTFEASTRQFADVAVEHVGFSQVKKNEPPYINDTCASGCGPTAYAMLLAFLDARERGRAARELRTPESHPGQFWLWPAPVTPFGGGPSRPITEYIRGNLGKAQQTGHWALFSSDDWRLVTGDLNRELGTLCADYVFGSTDNAWTDPFAINDGTDFFPPEAFNPYYHYEFESHTDGIVPASAYEETARDWVRDHGDPVIMGISFYPKDSSVLSSHYVLATGYRERATGWACAYDPQAGQDRWQVTATDASDHQFYMHFGFGGIDYEGWQHHLTFFAGRLQVAEKRHPLGLSVKSLYGVPETQINPQQSFKLRWFAPPTPWAPPPAAVKAELLVMNAAAATAGQLVQGAAVLAESLPFAGAGINAEHVLTPPPLIGHYAHGTKAKIRVSGENVYALSDELSIVNHPPFTHRFGPALEAPRGTFGPQVEVAQIADLETPHAIEVVRTNEYGAPLSPAQIAASGVEVEFSTYPADGLWTKLAVRAKADCTKPGGAAEFYWRVRDPAGQYSNNHGTGVHKETALLGAPLAVGDYAPAVVAEGHGATLTLDGPAPVSAWLEVPADPLTGQPSWGDVNLECDYGPWCGTLRVADAGPVGEHAAIVHAVDACGQAVERPVSVTVLAIDDYCNLDPDAPACGAELAGPFALTLPAESIAGGADKWYQGKAPADGVVEVFAATAGNPDLLIAIYDESMRHKGTSYGPGNTNFIRTALAPHQGYYVYVHNFEAAAAEFALSAAEPTPGPADAPSLTRGTYGQPELGHVGRPRVDQGDVDYYRIPVGSGIGSLKLTFSHAQGDLDMMLLDAAGVPVAYSNGVTDQEYIAMPSLHPSTHYTLYVYGYNGATNDYTLSANAAP